jgi:hypothetical protein
LKIVEGLIGAGFSRIVEEVKWILIKQKHNFGIIESIFEL